MMRIEGFPTSGGPLDIDIARGDIILLTGRNGSGKTSLMRAAAGLSAPILPRSVHAMGTIALMPQHARDMLVGLTVRGEFRLRAREVPPDLPLATRDSAHLSDGEARQIGLALTQGDIVLLDEPTEGLDEEHRADLRALVERHAANGAVMFSDHTGDLHSLATRTVALSGSHTASLPPLPAQGSRVVVEAARAMVARGAAVIATPHLALSSGLHALIGPNGGGKTTTLRHLAGLDEMADVRIEGTPPRPGMNVRFATSRASDAFTRDTVADELRGVAHDIAARLVPVDIRMRHPFQLSGGEAQRVHLAKALGRGAPLVLLDEPDAHLDDAGRAALFDAFAIRIAQGACIVMATHDASFTARAHTRTAIPPQVPG